MSETKTACVTGGTGFLGSFLVAFLLRQGYRVVALVRGAEASRRLQEVLREVAGDDLDGVVLEEQLQVVEGDVRKPGLGLTEEVQDELAETVDETWHCATSFKFHERDREEAAAHNIEGTRQVLLFADRCNQHRRTPVFHISTVCAAPVSGGMVREELPLPGIAARNLYEWSKQEGERLVAQFRQERGLPAFILRPSIIVGHSQSGRAVRFTGYYGVFRALYLLTRNFEVNLGAQFDRNVRLRILARPNLLLNLVPVDFVVESMWHLSRRVEGHDAFIFNVASNNPVPLSELFRPATDLLGVTGLELVEKGVFAERPMSRLEQIFHRQTQFQAPYLLDAPQCDTTQFRRLVSFEEMPCPAVDERLLRMVNEYYRDVLDQQFKVDRPVSSSSVRSESSLRMSVQPGRAGGPPIPCLHRSSIQRSCDTLREEGGPLRNRKTRWHVRGQRGEIVRYENCRPETMGTLSSLVDDGGVSRPDDALCVWEPESRARRDT